MSDSVRGVRRAGWAACACALSVAMWLLVGASTEPQAARAEFLGALTLRFLDVGDGDATWLTLPDGETALVDCGPASSSKQLVLRLQNAGIVRLDHLILTGTRANAVGGCADVLSQFVVSTLTWSGLTGDPKIWGPLQSEINYYGVAAQVPPNATALSLGGASLTTFERPPAGSADDQFDSSLVLLIEYAGWRSVLPGAIHANGESNATGSGLAYPIHILETPDNGSTAGGSDRFLRELFRPDLGTSCRLAVSSQGPDRRGLPGASSLRDRLSALCSQVFVTAENGSVIAQVAPDGSAPQVNSDH